MRACYTSALEGEAADLAGIIGVDSCDAMRRLYDVWCLNLSPEFSHFLTLPHQTTPEAVEFFASELRGLTDALAAHFGASMSDDDLARGIKVMNETRSLLGRLDERRRAGSSASGARFYEILTDAMIRPKREVNADLIAMLGEMDESGRDGGINIMLSGGVLDDPWVVSAIEQAGGRVVADDLCCGSRYFDGQVSVEGDPLLAIARRYIEKAQCARMTDNTVRFDRLMQTIEDTGTRGLIYYCVKFCDPHTLDWVLAAKRLQSMGIPALRCETDFSISARERMRTRIEAFLEMLA